MEEENKNTGFKSLKSEILLPIIFAMTLALAIMFIADSSFKADLEAFVIWMYFAVVILYTGAALFDLYKQESRTKGKKIFIAICSVLVLISAILYVIFYLVG